MREILGDRELQCLDASEVSDSVIELTVLMDTEITEHQIYLQAVLERGPHLYYYKYNLAGISHGRKGEL